VKKAAGTAAGVIGRVIRLSASVNAALAAVSCILVFLMMFYIVSDITGRYFFLRPMPGTLEIGETVLVFAVFMSMAYVLIRQEHIRVTVVFDRFPPKWQFWLEILALALGFGLTLIMSRNAITYAIYSCKVVDYAGSGGRLGFPLPLYPAKFAFFVGCTLFCIQFFLELLGRIFNRLTGKISAGMEKS
jgi:TRAP-type C4-dicarboxylate transport system permease small subunit